jgi:hypothetical protein
MRKIITFVTIWGLITTASLGLATITKGSQEEFAVSGTVEGIENGVISLREPNGEVFNAAPRSDALLQGIEVGDRVVVKIEGGRVVSVKGIGKAEMKQRTKYETFAPTEKDIIGEVTLVGENVLKVKEDDTQMEYTLTASSGKLEGVSTGYRVEVKAVGGKILSLTMLGMPTQATSAPDQRWMVIKEPQG